MHTNRRLTVPFLGVGGLQNHPPLPPRTQYRPHGHSPVNRMTDTFKTWPSPILRMRSVNICTLSLWHLTCDFRAAIACIGGMYEKLGRMVGRSYEETVSFLIKATKNAEVCFRWIMSPRGMNKILFERSICRADYLVCPTRILDNNNTIGTITVTRAMWNHADSNEGGSGNWISWFKLLQGYLQGSQAMYDGSSHDCEVCCSKGSHLALNMNRAN